MSSDIQQLASGAVPDAVLPPLPRTERGYGIHVSVNAKKGLLAYCNDTVVVVRSLENPKEAWTFPGHRCRVLVARISPNGEWIASGDEHGKVLVWGVKNMIIKNQVQATRRVLDIAWDADGKRIVAVGDGAEARAKVFAWDRGSNLGEIQGHTKAILSVDFKPSRPFRIVTSAEDNLLSFHEGPPFKFSHSFSEHTRFPNCVRYSPSGDHAISVGSDRKIIVFDGKTGEKVREIESKDNHTGSIFSFSWSPDGSQFLTASGDKTAKLWDFEGGSVVTTFTFGDKIEDQQVSAAWVGEHMITVSLSGAINFLDASNPSQPKRRFLGHQAGIRDLSVHGASKSIFSVCAGGRLTRWNSETGESEWATGSGHGTNITGVAASADGASIFTVGLDDKLRVAEAKSFEYIDAQVADLGGAPTAVAAGSVDAELAIATVAQGKVVVTRAGKAVHSTAVSFRPICVAISPDDSEVAVGGDDKKLHLYTLENDTLKERDDADIDVRASGVAAVSYSKDGKYLLSSDGAHQTFVVDRATNKDINPYGWKYHSAKVQANAWSPGGVSCATGSIDTHIIIWFGVQDGTFKGADRKKLEYTHWQGTENLEYLDDETLVSSGADKVIALWKATKE